MATRPRDKTSPRATRPALDDVSVSPMRRRHLRQVLHIEDQVYPRSWSPKLFDSELSRPETRRYVVARASDPDRPWSQRLLNPRPVVGYAGVLVQAEEAHITTVAVHPRHHRRKVATRLLVAVLTVSREMGAQAATLEVRAANRGAQRLYAGFGFAPVGMRPSYYAETNEDAVIMWVHELQGDEFARRLEAQRSRIGLPGGASGVGDLHVPWVRGRIGLAGGRGEPEETA